MSTKILVPIDFGPRGDELLRVASGFSRSCEAHLTLLHVCETERAGASSRGPVRSMVLLEEARRRLQKDGHVLVDLALTQGSAAHEIARFAREGTFDLIILGERAGGSESPVERIRGRAECPVMSVRIPPRHQPSAVHASSSPVVATWS